MIRKLAKIERLAKGNRLSRLVHHPVKYLSGIYFTQFVYPRKRKGKTVICKTFFESYIKVLLPAGLDLYLLGAKSHDSEIRLCKYLINNIEAGNSFLDIGAHFGYYSLLASTLVRQNGRVVSIEASNEIFNVLLQNILDQTNCGAFHLACTKTNGEISFYEFPLLYSEYNTLHIEQFEKTDWIQNNKPKKNLVEGKSLNSLCNDLDFRPDFIKIDVEGAELDIILGGQKVLAKYKPIVAMEFLFKKSNNDLYDQAFQEMEKLGYAGHIITSQGVLEKVSLDQVHLHFKTQGLDSDNIVFVNKEVTT